MLYLNMIFNSKTGKSHCPYTCKTCPGYYAYHIKRKTELGSISEGALKKKMWITQLFWKNNHWLLLKSRLRKIGEKFDHLWFTKCNAISFCFLKAEAPWKSPPRSMLALFLKSHLKDRCHFKNWEKTEISSVY